MKINKSELERMINQIDDDLLHEAAGECNKRNFGVWKRVVPAAACIILLVSGTAISALRNSITIEKSHEGIEGADGAKDKGETDETYISDTAGAGSRIQIKSTAAGERWSLNNFLDEITSFLRENEVSENVTIDSVELKVFSDDNIISNGKVMLTDKDSSNNIMINISQDNIIINIEEQASGEEEILYKENLQNNKTAEEEVTTSYGDGYEAMSFSSEISEIEWYDFSQAAKCISDISPEFPASDYRTISAESVSGTDANLYQGNRIILYDDQPVIVDSMEKIENMEYSYSFFISVSVEPDTAPESICVVVK